MALKQLLNIWTCAAESIDSYFDFNEIWPTAEPPLWVFFNYYNCILLKYSLYFLQRQDFSLFLLWDQMFFMIISGTSLESFKVVFLRLGKDLYGFSSTWSFLSTFFLLISQRLYSVIRNQRKSDQMFSFWALQKQKVSFLNLKNIEKHCFNILF